MSGPDTAGADGGSGGRERGQPAAAHHPPSYSTSGGRFLLELLQSSSSPAPTPHHQHHHHHHDPAVASFGPAVPIPSSPPFFSLPFPHSPPAQNLWHQPGHFDPGLPRFPQAQPRPGFLPGHLRPPQPPEAKSVVLMEDGLVFGSVKCEAAGVAPTNGLLPGPRVSARVLDPPPGFGPRRISQFQRVEGSSPSLHQVKHAGGTQSNGLGQVRRESARWPEEGGERASNGRDLPPSIRLGSLGPPSGSSLRSGPLVDHGKMINGRSHENVDSEEEEDKDVGTTSERLTEILTLRDESAGKNDRRQFGGSRGKDLRSNLPRGVQIPNYMLRSRRRVMECRRDVETLTPLFLSIYESLVPSEEEKVKQNQLFASLETLIYKEWPKALLYLYGSCANTFAFSNSDIDVCLSIDETGFSKTDILLKLADILKSGNMENVQPLTRARVPIVKLMDPVTGISCDICINNLLAVTNTKLLRDYAQIDARLHQLAFIVKHWAKCRGVNETYRGTLSSYAYVLMCIHFLQIRNPAILPCLQEMKATYVVNVDDVECAYYDKVENLDDFGSRNRESLAKLLWKFFDYWAYRHDYTNDVISVRIGSIISKREKDWTRRVGNDRHLICIEDPFEVSHDLGRVVDRYSIKDLRAEFERAAYILHYDRNPCVSLFEPYMP